MNEEIKEQIEVLKKKMLDFSWQLTIEDREAFFCEINEWTYERYEECLLASE